MINGVNEKPKVGHRVNAGKVVPESAAKDDKTLDEVIIIVQIPKPEVLIFANKMNIRYNEVPLEQNFAVKIMEPIRKPPF